MEWPTEAPNEGVCARVCRRPPRVARTHTRLALAAAIAVVLAASPGCGGRDASSTLPETPPGEAEASSGSTGPEWLSRTTSHAFSSHSTGQVSIEYPEQNWRVVPDDEGTMATFAHGDGDATVTVEQAELLQALAPEEVTEVFGELEAETIKEREPDASDFDIRLIEEGTRRVVGVQYQRSTPQAQVVRQYSFPIGKTLYRLTCVMKPDEMDELEPICSHMAASFKPSGT